MNFHRCLPGAFALLLAGCAPNHVLFVTSTSLGFNTDTEPATLSLAYDRTEGYFGPSYENGAIPPVFASLNNEGGFISPKIRQFYATGNAAIIAAGAHPPAGDAPPLSGVRHWAFAGTTTTIGAKVAFMSGAPASANIGYKRKEFSYIAVGSASGVDAYPSVLFSTAPELSFTSQAGSTYANKQMIATGLAAEALAGQPAVISTVKAVAAEGVASGMGATLGKDQLRRSTSIMGIVAPNGALDPAKLQTLADAAKGRCPDKVRNLLSPPASLTADQVEDMLKGDISLSTCLLNEPEPAKPAAEATKGA